MTKPAKLEHRDGCPAEPERTETYPVRSPAGGHVQVTRCMSCGAHHPPAPENTGPLAGTSFTDNVTMRRVPGGDAA